MAFVATLIGVAGPSPLAPGAGAAANYTQTRYAGVNRFDTSALIASAIPDRTRTAVLARADTYPDALTGAFAATANGDGPLLLTHSESVPNRTMQALRDEGVQNVILLGGEEAVLPSVQEQLSSAGYNVSRIAGATRYHTAIEIAKAGADVIGTVDGQRSALISSADDFPDALSAAPLSFAAGLPSLLVPADLDDPDSTRQLEQRTYFDAVVSALKELNIGRVYVLGGDRAVSAGVEAALRGERFDVTRLGGEDRSATSVEVFKFGMDEGFFTNRRFGLARGDAFPDALAYGPLGGRLRPTVAPESDVVDTSPMANGLLLAAANCTLSDSVEQFLLDNDSTWSQGEILGGGEAICPEVAAEVEASAQFGFVSIILDSQSTEVGGSIAGRVTGENVATVTASGCGLDNRPVGVEPVSGRFIFGLSISQTSDCTLRFTSTLINGATDTDIFAIDVLGPNEPHDEPNVVLSPNAGPDGNPRLRVTLTGNRPGAFYEVTTEESGCAIQEVDGSAGRATFRLLMTEGRTTCIVVSGVYFSDGRTPVQLTFRDIYTRTAPVPPAPTPAGGVSAGRQLATGGPDLVSTTIIDGIPNNGILNSVRYTFDADVQFGAGPADNGQPTRFSVQGFDSSSRQDSSGVIGIDPSDPKSVIAQFSDAIDLRPFTIGTTDAGAVTDGTNPSVLASRALGGSTFGGAPGRTAAPDLLSAEVNPTAQQITYMFDQPVMNPTATQFGFYTASGGVNTGDSTLAFSGTQSAVTVQFGAPVLPGGPGAGRNNDPVETAVRFFVNDTGALDTQGDGESAVEGTTTSVDNPLGHTGFGTTAPELISVSKVTDQPGQFDFTFDEAVLGAASGVLSPIPSNFAVYQDDGTRYDGDVVAQNGANTVRVTFNSPANELNQNNVGQIVLAGVQNRAIVAAAGSNQPNTIDGTALTSTGAGPGFTDGPDLIGATFNSDTNQVTYEFDEPVADVGPFGPPVPGEFFIVSASGAFLGAGTAQTTSGSTVTVTFGGGGVGAAAGAGVESGTGSQDPTTGTFFVGNLGLVDGPAVTDFQGNANPPDSVGGGPAAPA